MNTHLVNGEPKMNAIIDIWEKIREHTTPWSPEELIRVNDQVIRLALFDGEFPMHKHSNADELFFVVKGQITIRFKDKAPITLKEGQMTVVPKGVLHSPKSLESSHVLMFEPQILNPRGD